jgi:hypothetical protein
MVRQLSGDPHDLLGRFRKVGQGASWKTLRRIAFEAKSFPALSLIIFANLQGP